MPAELFHKGQIVFDAVYNPYETLFLQEAKARGAQIIYGIDMLLYQGTAQFTYYTNHDAPAAVMRQSLIDHFGLPPLTRRV